MAQATISRENWECVVGFWPALQDLHKVSTNTCAPTFGSTQGQERTTQTAGIVAEVFLGSACCRFPACFVAATELSTDIKHVFCNRALKHVCWIRGLGTTNISDSDQTVHHQLQQHYSNAGLQPRSSMDRRKAKVGRWPWHAATGDHRAALILCHLHILTLWEPKKTVSQPCYADCEHRSPISREGTHRDQQGTNLQTVTPCKTPYEWISTLNPCYQCGQGLGSSSIWNSHKNTGFIKHSTRSLRTSKPQFKLK